MNLFGSGSEVYDAIIVGAGFYGVVIAIHLYDCHNFRKILLVEKESDILRRASRNNQARVHNGYHYPRSFKTASRSRVNLPKFTNMWPSSIFQDFTNIYAISRRNSKVTSRQFEKFCGEIKADIWDAPKDVSEKFNSKLIEKSFLVKEYSFDYVKISEWARQCIKERNICLLCDTKATELYHLAEQKLKLVVEGAGRVENKQARYLFNCTYSNLNSLSGDCEPASFELKHEITEMALFKPPKQLDGMGVTVMDGPFFSFMPYPSLGLSTLSHVRYTPHVTWDDDPEICPYEKLECYPKNSRFEWMIRDVDRYLPGFKGAEYVDSLFEVKTVLKLNEQNDGRPIVFERMKGFKTAYSILGGKLDNIFDVLERIDVCLK